MTPPPPPARVVGPLTRTDLVRYQGASGDMNPIHHDELFATAAGFPSPFSLGMLQAGVLADWATSWLGAENVRSYRVRFKEQVWPGDTITCSGSILGTRALNGEELIDVELTCTRQTGGVAVQGWATFVASSREDLESVDE